MWLFFLQGVTLGFSAAVLPGPLQAFLITQTTQHGWRRTLPAVLAPLLSDGPIILLMVFILTQLPPLVLTLIQVVGGLFILYLAWRAWQSLQKPADTASQPAGQPQTVWQATLTNLLNPNPFIFWGTVGGLALVEGWRTSAGHGLAFLVGMYGTMLTGLALFIVLVGTVGAVKPELNRWLGYTAAVLLLGFGLWQLATAF